MITVVYNGADTLERTVESVLSQDYRDIQYIIIDGGSSDGTTDIIRKYEKSISYWISEPDGGIYDAMNKGLSRATGDIIGILNSDDYYNSGALCKVVEKFKNTNSDVVYGNAVVFDDSGETGLFQHEHRRLLEGMSIPHPATFVKKGLFDRFGAFDENYKVAADYDFMLRLYLQGRKFSFLDETIAYFKAGGYSDKNHLAGIRESLDIILRQTRSLLGEMSKDEHDLVCSGVFRRAVVLDPSLIREYIYERFGRIPVSIWGAGSDGKIILQSLKNDDYPIEHVVDGNADAWGKVILGKTISGPQALKNYEGVVVISSSVYQDEIANKAIGLGADKLILWQDIAGAVTQKVIKGYDK